MQLFRGDIVEYLQYVIYVGTCIDFVGVCYEKGTGSREDLNAEAKRE
jgi:hypothetical protein